ncbi:hypothetical protein BDY19DRAFT_469538 [Irpex rosettiformis]|uniref:Uncharacterized protein n=1 Tax=Irpex rosettiformis TaxID=378272 RepID=A0ACB8TSE3_9APHY|nr:hypothetical protein BDY19DRAFT_469538 [Irpex rosettiformis]
MSAPQQFPASSVHSTTLTPYLQLPHLLSLTWLAYPILSLLFVAFRLQLSSDSAQSSVDSAKENLIASCLAAEKAATATASMPRYMAVATNARIADAANATMQGAGKALILALTVMEAIINFIVDMYRSTFLCFLELVVRGGLSILIGAVQELNNAVGAVAGGIRTAIQDAVQGVNDIITKIPGVKGISVPDLSALQNVTLPQDFTDALTNLNNSLPTLSELKGKLDDIIDTPFELVKKDINETFSNLTFNANAFPIPEQNTVTFCDQMDTSIVDDLGRDLVKIAKIGVIIIILLVLVLLAANCALEWYKWRCLQNHLRYTREAWSTDPAIYHGGSKTKGTPTLQLSNHNLLMLQGNMSHPLLTKIANRISSLLRLSPNKHIHLTWFFHYVFHPPALACFLIGFFGLLSVQVQLLAIGPLEHKYQHQAAASASDFSNLIATSINNTMYNQSAAYANTINARVDTVQNTINDGLFGWVNGTTTTLNDTINAFYDDLQGAVQTVFGGTILESPVEEFIKCFVGSKVDAVEKALTFLHDNLNVDMPRVNESVLVLSPQQVNEATQPIAAAAIGGGGGSGSGDGGDGGGVVGKLVNAYVESLKKERIMFSIFIGLWGLVVLMGVGIIWWHSRGRDMVERWKKRRWEKTQRRGMDGVVVPFRDFGDSETRHSEVEKGHGVGGEGRQGLFRSLAPPRTNTHPYGGENGQRPGFEKSWDSFLDNANASQPTQETRPTAIGPRRFLTLGRSGSDASASQPEQSELPWLTRFTTKFWKRDSPSAHEEDLVDEKRSIASSSITLTGTPAEKSKPRLTITTTNGSVQSLHTSIHNEDWEENLPVEPTSAWSVSPRKSTWLSGITTTKLKSMSVSRPKSRSRARKEVVSSVPSDVDSGEQEAVDAPVPIPVAMPLHHGFERFSTPPLQFSAPPQHPSIGAKKPVVTVATRDSVPYLPPGIGYPKYHHDSLGGNPFATPFDDERYAVATSPTSPLSGSAGRNGSGNPFVVM